MDPSLKRNIFPMNNWDEFLKEGKKEFQDLYDLKSIDQCKKNDFTFMQILGKGAFGRVFLALMNNDNTFHAIKVLDKSGIMKLKQINHAKNEKRILQSLNHPFTVSLDYFFHDNNYLYFVLPFLIGGEMFCHLRKMKRFEEPLTRFYSAQVILAFEYLHFCGLVYRDLKPENLVLDQRGYLKLTDFGFCKMLHGRTYTMCGTPEYLAPEIILSKGYGKAVDWWSFGVLLYELTAGVPPFSARDPMKIYEKAVALKYAFPKSFSADLENLITNMLQVDLSKRYGNLKNGVSDIKYHKWFKTINWESLFNRKAEPPYVPTVKHPGDTSNFDTYKEMELHTSSTNRFSSLFNDF